MHQIILDILDTEEEPNRKLTTSKCSLLQIPMLLIDKHSFSQNVITLQFMNDHQQTSGMDDGAPTPEIKPLKPDPQSTKSGPDDLWHEFRSYSTLHGLHFATETKWSFRRVIWTLLVLLASGFMINELYSNYKKYFRFDVLYTTEYQHSENLTFPAVSICNYNMMRKSKIVGTDAQRYLDFQDPLKSSVTNTSDDNWNSSFNIEREVRAKGHQLSEMLLYCTWLGRKCDAHADFVPFLDFRVSFP